MEPILVRILGSGASGGTPTIDGGWGKCDPGNPKNRRTRPSIFVEADDTRVLVDTPPDLRGQLLAAGVSTVSALVYTHSHADHVHGIDDLRAINRALDAPLDVYSDRATLDTIRKRFPYVFEPLNENARFYYKPALVPHLVKPGDNWIIGRIQVTAFEQHHGFSKTLGLRFGPVAYTTDVVDLSEEAFSVLRGIDTWIIGTLTDRPHPTHCDVDKALAWIRRIRPRRAVLSHLGETLDYDTLAARLPPGVEPAYDGMLIEANAVSP
jgi:phosphoribosyl 1,2-cyclic phosphate phosphodiesterase